MKKRGFLAAYISIVSALLLSMLVSTTVARYVKDAESGGSYGEVSIRSYYDSGRGTKGDPYRITRPIHLYNLSRLQGLGCYSGTGEKKTYFQLGKEVKVGNTIEYKCYATDTSKDLNLDYLDMNQYSHPIEAIGSETTPFYGEFDGKNLEIRNLTVYADPQDAGLFGYTAHASKVHNLFLDNITIDTKGYAKGDSTLSSLYSGEVSKFSPKFTYTSNGRDWEFNSSSSPTGNKDETHSFAVDWTNESTTDSGPTVSWSTNYSGFRYKLLPSGGLLSATDLENGTFGVDNSAVISWFKKGKNEPDAKWPLTASSSMSILAYRTTRNGYLRSRVLLTLSFDFSLYETNPNTIQLSIHVARPHGNNIGLIIGHCDGTVEHCYVHNGSFLMNSGDANAYQAMANGSDTGLIGVQGNTVKNVASEDAGASAREGKTVGILDFSNVYKTVVGNSPTFTIDNGREYQKDDQSYENPYYYTPVNTVSAYYKDLLRRLTVNGSTRYYTAEENSITFKGQEVLQGTDLGVFKVATDHTSDGIDANAMDDGMARTVVRSETPHNYLYYSTGEFRKTGDDGNATGETFADYRDSFSDDQPSKVLLGHHFPAQGQVTWQSFERRETAQNYFIRFKMNANRPTTSGFYFSDLDQNTVGGSFLTKYLEYKLVDEDNKHIYVKDTGEHITSTSCGITFKDRVTKNELGELTASFATRDLSNKSKASNKMWCINNSTAKFPVANMVNFEITTDWANVTVVAAPTDSTKSAALGVYKINPTTDYDTTTVTDSGQTIEYRYVKRSFDDPDYAFFMPNDKHLAYYDYKVCAVNASNIEDANGTNSKGRIGTYYNGTTFKQATYGTPATVPGAFGATEYDHTAGTPRLFVHTFKLPMGRYCLGSPTGTSSVKKDLNNNDVDLGLTSSKIYYVCAQGQDDGDTDFVDNVYGDDIVENIDFLRTSREYIDILDPDDLEHSTSLKANRCYLMLAENNRSSFAANHAELSFVYVDGKMVIAAGSNNAYLSAMTKVSIANYGKRQGLASNTTIKLFNANDDTSDSIIYPGGTTP